MIALCRKQFKDHTIIYVNTYFKDFVYAEENYECGVAGFSLDHCGDTEKKAFEKHPCLLKKRKPIFIHRFDD